MNSLIKLQKRRGVSQVVGTVLILAVTVAGAAFLSNLMSEEFFAVDQNPVTDARVDSLRLTSYDTRDSVKLTNIRNLNNTFNQMLCTSGDSTECTITNADNLPINGGTEFIVLQVKNMNLDSVFIHNVLISNVGHTWDDQATGVLDLTDDLSGTGNYPGAGKFSIVSTENDYASQDIIGTHEIQGGAEVRLIVKLSDSIPQDIGMWSSLRVLVNFGGSQPAEFIILSGDAKW